ncbi:hypothetical protein GLOIN_2v1591384 [Rhizophagus clarus]|uniref:Uncharacterized protein n=1 Tax=Rhizophagus clarus TaxID=94130 RepID=A0A8H3LXY0_9GLOM|nr:hypothetical protein GLOIN_2v1591384 [Rhizophagus clarus]
MATKRGEKRNIDDNERISRRNTEKSSEAEKRIRLSDDNVEVNKKSIEKLLRTNSLIISKLERKYNEVEDNQQLTKVGK